MDQAAAIRSGFAKVLPAADIIFCFDEAVLTIVAALDDVLRYKGQIEVGRRAMVRPDVREAVHSYAADVGTIGGDCLKS